MPKISLGAIIAMTATGLFLSLVTAGLITTSNLNSNGTISAVNVGVYSDSACTINCTSLDWETIPPGNSTIKVVYVKNTGTLPVTLSMTVDSWQPTNENSYLTLVWNATGTGLDADESVAARFTLTVAADPGDVTDFSFNIIITGAE